MAYVKVPKDLSKVKRKSLFNLTKRQLISIIVSAIVGIPIFLLLKNINTTFAFYGMLFISMPIMFTGFYIEDGIGFEKKIFYYFRRIYKNGIRKYYSKNRIEIYEEIMKDDKEKAKE